MALTELLALNLYGPFNLGTSTFDVSASSFTGLGTGTILSGGTINAPGGVSVGGAEVFRAGGAVNGALALAAGGTLTVTGPLTIGDADRADGIFSGGRILVNNHTLTLLDLDEAVLGSSTVLGTASADGTLNAPAGVLLEAGRNLSGRGTINTSAGEFRNDGRVAATGPGLIFNDLVTGKGRFSGDITFNGGTDFGNSPARIVMTGNTVFGASNAHLAEIGGIVAGKDYDQLDISGTATLGGVLNVSLIHLGAGNAPMVGDRYEIIKAAGGITGTFSSVSLPALADGQEWNVIYESHAVVLTVTPTATVGVDAFVLNYSANSVAISLAVNGGVSHFIGTLPLSGSVRIPGLSANDSVTVIGTPGNDEFSLTNTGIRINNTPLIVNSAVSLTLAGGSGDDLYRIVADVPRGTITLNDTGGYDTLTFAPSTVGVTVDLSNPYLQFVNQHISLILSSADSFEALRGGQENDVLTGNALDNLIAGHDGDDILNGLGGNDTLIGGNGDDVYVMSPASAAEVDTLIELNNAGNDTIDFSALTDDVTIALNIATLQAVHTNRAIQLSSAGTFENVAGGSGNDVLTGNWLANILIGNGGNDRLLGGHGRDILIGGDGADILNGGADDDILISGSTSYDALFADLNVLKTEWLSSDSYAARVENLRSGVGTPTRSLTAGVTVLPHQSPRNRLIGFTGDDWFLGEFDDLFSDRLLTEELDTL